MRPVVIVSGILGGGTALVFAFAALAATLVPSGTLVPTQGMWMGGGFRAVPAIDRVIMVDEMGVAEPDIFMGNEGGGFAKPMPIDVDPGIQVEPPMDIDPGIWVEDDLAPGEAR